MSNLCREYNKKPEHDVCKSCRNVKKHDRWFGYCKYHNRQVKLDETCSYHIKRDVV